MSRISLYSDMQVHTNTPDHMVHKCHMKEQDLYHNTKNQANYWSRLQFVLGL